MKQRPFTAARLRSVLKYDSTTGLFVRIAGVRSDRIGTVAGSENNAGYWTISVDGRLYLAHRLAWLYVHGRWPQNRVDHKNRQRLDNRFDNLRKATDSQNAMNRGANKKSKTKTRGVFQYPNGRFRAQISFEGRTRSLGYFSTKEEAAIAYNLAAREICGEFAYTAS